MASKRFIGKPCAYCRVGVATTADHVVAREFFFEEDRMDLPKVPSCSTCNGKKSKLEHYATAALMAGTQHKEAQRYRQEKVRPRLLRNRKLQDEIGLNRPQVWRQVNGVYTRMQQLTVDGKKIHDLLSYVVTGLYHHHFGKPLDGRFWAEISMIHPHSEAELWARMLPQFPGGSYRASKSLGRGAFDYEMSQSPYNEALTVWRMRLHGGISLHGSNTPAEGVQVWWCVTRPTPEALAAESNAGSATFD